MVPNIARRGHSFKGIAAYLLNPQRDDPEQKARVAWSMTYNLHTDDVDRASRWMAWTDANRELLRPEDASPAGRKGTAGNVYHVSLSWAPDERPEREQMEAAVAAAVERLNLSHHQHYVVAHDDKDYRHVHIVLNLVDHDTGRIASVYKDREKLDRWANEYEQQNGIQCEQRAAKYEALEQDRPGYPQPSAQKVRGRDDYAQAATLAFQQSDSAEAFRAALEAQGLTLASGNRRGFVVVDDQGEVYALSRLVEGARAKDISARLQEIDKESLRRADDLAAERARTASEAQGEGGQGAPLAASSQDTTTTTRRTDDVHKTTAELAEEYEQLCQDPLHEVRGGMDAQGREPGPGEELRGVSSGPAGAIPGDDGLRSLPAETERELPSDLGRAEPERYARALSERDQARRSRQEAWSELRRSAANQRGEGGGYFDSVHITHEQAFREARDFYRLDALREEQRQAEAAREKTKGFWGWLLGRQKQADEALQQASKNLQSAEARVREVVETRLRFLPDEVREQEMAKLGLASAAPSSPSTEAAQEAVASARDRAAAVREEALRAAEVQQAVAARAAEMARAEQERAAALRNEVLAKAEEARRNVANQPVASPTPPPVPLPLPKVRGGAMPAAAPLPIAAPPVPEVRVYTSYTPEERGEILREELQRRLQQEQAQQAQPDFTRAATPAEHSPPPSVIEPPPAPAPEPSAGMAPPEQGEGGGPERPRGLER